MVDELAIYWDVVHYICALSGFEVVYWLRGREKAHVRMVGKFLENSLIETREVKPRLKVLKKPLLRFVDKTASNALKQHFSNS